MLLTATLSVDYRTRPGVLRDFCLNIEESEIVGLVGSSGCGKSTFALALLGLIDRNDALIQGSISFQGHNIIRLTERQYRSLRGKEFSLVLQSPISALSPSLTVGGHLREAWVVHQPSKKSIWHETALSALQKVSLPVEEEFLRRPARQLSVGMAQRLLIAMAILHRPSLLIADEATSALDVIHQAGILDLFSALRADYGMAILFITHDLAAAAHLCDRIAVMHRGHAVEVASPRKLFSDPKHEYTRQLVQALPKPPEHLASPVSLESPLLYQADAVASATENKTWGRCDADREHYGFSSPASLPNK